MKAVRVTRPGGPEVLSYDDVETPKPDAGQVLVKVAAAGVNFIDVYKRTGLYKVPLPHPFIIGEEGAGVVAAVGASVTDFAEGDHVAYTQIPQSYAEYVAVPAERLVHVPSGVDDTIAAAVMLQGLTAHYLCHSTYAVQPGDSLLVHAAAGGVGLLLTQMVKMRGGRVIATVSTDEKAALARGAGADEVINYEEADFEAETKRLTDGKGCAAVYDSVGKNTFDKSLNCLRPRGYMVLYGASSGPVPPIDPQILNAKGSLYLTRPTLGNYIATREELEARTADIFGWIAAGKLSVRTEHSYALADAAQAHRDLEARKTTGKILLVP